MKVLKKSSRVDRMSRFQFQIFSCAPCTGFFCSMTNIVKHEDGTCLLRKR